MKRILLLSSFLFVLFSTNATTRTVSNNPNTVAQDSTIQEAINKSSVGDTVLIQGSPNVYAGFNLNIPLTIIGPGWKPIRAGNPLTAMVQNISTMTISSSASGSEIQGLTFLAGNPLIIDPNTNVTNIRLLRNHFSCNINIRQSSPTLILTYSGFLLEGNWFDNGMFILGYKYSNYQNFLIQNNLFVQARMLYFIHSINILINHNLFYKDGSSAYYPFLNDNNNDAYAVWSEDLKIENNVFYNANLVYAYNFPNTTQWWYSIRNCSFKNNITYQCADNPWSATNGNYDLGGNVNNLSPNIASQTAVLAGTNDPTFNFTIANGPANNSALDGRDMGLIFDATGSLNWNNCRMSRIPYVYSFQIANPNVGPGGSVNITIEARRNN